MGWRVALSGIPDRLVAAIGVSAASRSSLSFLMLMILMRTARQRDSTP
jgi:hypothetical protein